ncbi:MAG: Hpt domain-containing protein [Limnothrix sp.]
MSDNLSLAAEVSLNDLKNMLGDDPEMLIDIVTSFLEDAPKLMQAIQEGFDAQNVELLERSAHTIKSSSRLFCAEQFAVQCQNIEDSAKTEKWDQIKPMVSKLQSNYLIIAQELQTQMAAL